MDTTELIAFYQSLSPENLDRLPEFYAAEAELIDPMNHARGIDQIRDVYADLFKQLNDVEFRVKGVTEGDGHVHFHYTMDYKFRKKARSIEGCSHLELGAEGLIRRHRDYWDAGLGVYAEFPLLGFAIRKIRKMVQVWGDA